MNKLLDLVNTWSEKLALRALRLSGASDDAIKKYSEAVTEKDKAFISANKELDIKFQWYKAGVIFLVLFIGVYIGTRLFPKLQ